jgi:hypothetical protein
MKGDGHNEAARTNIDLVKQSHTGTTRLMMLKSVNSAQSHQAAFHHAGSAT